MSLVLKFSEKNFLSQIMASLLIGVVLYVHAHYHIAYEVIAEEISLVKARDFTRFYPALPLFSRVKF